MGEELFFDATKVEANASLDVDEVTLPGGGSSGGAPGGRVPRGHPAHDEEYVGVFAGVVGPEGQERQALAQTNVLRHRWIAENGDQERELVRRDYKRMADSRVSITDPDASPMQQKNKCASRLGYLTHYVVDGGRRA